MALPLILPLRDCDDPARVGGKAAHLGRLQRASFRVPSGLCLTTEAYRQVLREAGLDTSACWRRAVAAEPSARATILHEIRQTIAAIPIPSSLMTDLRAALAACAGPDTSWAVRSSASDEDTRGSSFAGAYRTVLDVKPDGLAPAIAEVWASLWSPSAFEYRRHAGPSTREPAMAVAFQPMLAPRAAGVAYSRHPVTGRSGCVVINAVAGLGERLVSGAATPDQYVVTGDGAAPTIAERSVAPTSAGVPPPILSDDDIRSLAVLVTDIERAFGHPVDMEWALDREGFWVLQARPIAGRVAAPSPAAGAVPIVWSRANFKETLPDLPSPLGLSFLEEFMELNIVRHYREWGCIVPPGWTSVRIVQGRPYINVSLFQSFVVQLGGDPTLVVEQMGGEAAEAPPFPPRMAWWKLLRAGLTVSAMTRRADRQAEAWLAELKGLARQATDGLSSSAQPAEVLARLERAQRRLRAGDLTLAIVGGVSQGLWLLGLLLKRRAGGEWRALFNRSLLGVGTIISAQQIARLHNLATVAGRDDAALAFLRAEPFVPDTVRTALRGSPLLAELDRYLDDYGHRAIGESDPASPRFAERPDYILGIVRAQLLSPETESGEAADARRRTQEGQRAQAYAALQRSFGWRWHERLFFEKWHARLRRFLTLREANRHALMYFTAAARHLLLLVGSRLVEQGVLRDRDDIFFLTAQELRGLVAGEAGDWGTLVERRREERAAYARVTAPDTIVEGASGQLGVGRTGPPDREPVEIEGRVLRGIPISAGYAEGPVRLIRTPADLTKVQRGEILVVSVIDPGMAPLFGLAAGLVAEIGGTLSHGAIIAREYGLPAIANVPGVMRLLNDGEPVVVDAARGEIRSL